MNERFTRAVLLSLLFITGACGLPAPVGQWPHGEEPNYSKVRVYYATDRNPTGSADPGERYGQGRSLNGRLWLGHCDVSIPRDHRMGIIERPALWRFEFREDPEKHVVLLDVRQRSYEAFYADVRSRVEWSKAKSALVFIHGFNVEFEAATHRTAQLAYDLAFDGAPILYTWPSSSEGANSYMVAEANAAWTAPHFEWFLRDLAARSGATTIHVIAHSMGNRPLLQTLAAMGKGPLDGAVLNQVVLMAPDIDADVFRQMAASVRNTAAGVTLYASANDAALNLSGVLHGYQRAGHTQPSVVVVPGIDTIDATEADTSLVGHSYYGDRRSVLADVYWLFAGKGAEGRFGLTRMNTPSGAYYYFKP